MSTNNSMSRWKTKITCIFLAGWFLCVFISLCQMWHVGIKLNIWLIAKVVAVYFGVMAFLWFITFLAGKSKKEK